jgi:Transposase
VRAETPRQSDQATAVPRLRNLLRYNLQTARAYLLKEDFQQFWDYEQPSWAGKFLDEWCCQVMRSRIDPMKKIARTLRSHRALILNYFRARKQLSSGVVEGLNNKAKLTMRKSYGFRTFHVTEIALYHGNACMGTSLSSGFVSAPYVGTTLWYPALIRSPSGIKQAEGSPPWYARCRATTLYSVGSRVGSRP